MSRRKQIVIIICSVLLAVCAVPAGIGGYFYLENQRMKTEMVKIVKDHHQLLLDYMQSKEIDPHRRVKTVTIEYDETRHNPGGGIIVDGFINKDKNLSFELGIDKDNLDGKEIMEVTGGGLSEKLSTFLE